MARNFHVAILSDIHYAGPAEQARGDDFEFRDLKNLLLRLLMKNYRRHIWLRHPFGQNHLLDEFIARAGSPDFVIANGDYNADTKFVGVSDDASFQSARQCLEKLRAAFAPNFRAILGDHELGKLGFFGGSGGMRLASWRRARKDLDLSPLWQVNLGNYVLLGITSSLVALPLFEPDLLPAERSEWVELRGEHIKAIREGFAALRSEQRLVLFCHDPSALPFLWQDEIIRRRLSQLELTVTGHLHSNLVFRTSRLLAGIPPIHFLGHTARRMSTALSEARCWRQFKVKLCPSLAGVELLKDGGYCTLELDRNSQKPVQFRFHHLKR